MAAPGIAMNKKGLMKRRPAMQPVLVGSRQACGPSSRSNLSSHFASKTIETEQVFPSPTDGCSEHGGRSCCQVRRLI